MADLKQLSPTILSQTSSVDVNTTSKTDLYTVPTGYTAYITAVVIRDSSASLAGGTDFDFGTGANADTWKTAVDLSGMTTLATDVKLIVPDEFTECAAGDVFGIKATTATTGACTVTIDVIGYLV